MALWGYKPKNKKAPWVGQKGLSQAGAQVSQNRTLAGRVWSAKRAKTRLDRKNASKRVLERKKAPLRRESEARSQSLSQYYPKARAFVRAERRAGKTCPVFAVFEKLPREMQEFLTQPWDGKRRSNKLNETHHTHGRTGRLLLYTPWWLALSKWGHRSVHAFPKIARQFGWLCEQGEWNKPPPAY